MTVFSILFLSFVVVVYFQSLQIGVPNLCERVLYLFDERYRYRVWAFLILPRTLVEILLVSGNMLDLFPHAVGRSRAFFRC